MPLHLEAARLWSDLPVLTGEDIEVEQSGGLMIAEDAAQVSLLEQKTEIERAWGLDIKVIDRAMIEHIAPYLSPRVLAAARCPIEGRRMPVPLHQRWPVPLCIRVRISARAVRSWAFLVKAVGGVWIYRIEPVGRRTR